MTLDEAIADIESVDFEPKDRTTKGGLTMKEYISREEVLKKFLERGSGYITELTMMDMINAIPTAVVQPVNELDIMKAVDEQLQTVIDGTMEDNRKETNTETRRYGEGFCAGLELAQRYIRNQETNELERQIRRMNGEETD